MNDVKQKKLKYLAGILAAVLYIVALLPLWNKGSVRPKVLKIGIAVYNLEDILISSVSRHSPAT